MTSSPLWESGWIMLALQLKIAAPYRMPPFALPWSSILAIFDMPIRSTVNFLLSSQLRSFGPYRYHREPLPSSRTITSTSATHLMSFGQTKLLHFCHPYRSRVFGLGHLPPPLAAILI